MTKPDYESAARDAGYQVRHDMHGFYVLTDAEAKHEDEGNSSVGFDARPHYETIEEAARACCDALSIGPRDVIQAHTPEAVTLAAAILKAAGSDLRHYTMAKTREAIIAAAQTGVDAARADLLAALKEAAADIHRCRNGDVLDLYVPHGIAAKMLAAIAKAEGRS